jgi:transcriptional regulator with GAF, ATPase, and Fis domain
LGGLYFEDSHPLDTSDLLFLQALAAQLALALDRARLADDDRRRLEQEGRRLRAELGQLAQALQRAKLEYRSGEMEGVLAIARRVAPTDATVLIMGESGTGKELLARTIHELSPRRNRPLIIVDCGSIAASLADSELFGHERGAYTGAQERKFGRLAEGNGGTVLLDEIGELPLEIQSKLLRFVQEKQITTVGGTQARKVDVRIIAATNRDLASDVGAGRFREDLYHRLNVVRLVVPPLRARPDDILYLANLFLEKYSILHHKPVQRLAPESEALLLRHDWPGNVRELQNRLMQAVILCENDELEPAELGLLLPAGSEPAVSGPQSSVEPSNPQRDSPQASGKAGAPDRPASAEQLLECLRAALAQQIESARNGIAPLAMPLGRWLTADLILEADTAAAGVVRGGAALVGIPESTFRRLLGNASQQAKAGLSPRPSSWESVRKALQGLIRAPDLSGDDLVQRTRRLLLQEVLVRAPENERTGAALLGVSLPTFRRHVARIARAG